MEERQEQPTLVELVGGVRGVVDSALPTVVFVVVFSAAGLRPAVFAAVAVGLVVAVLRLVRRQPVRQALGGFVGVAVSAFVASRMHRAEGFFLPGILLNAGYGLAAVASVLLRRPAVGYLASAIDRRFTQWRDSEQLRRAAVLATLVWAGVFLARAAVQGYLYLNANVGWLAAARLGMGLPLFAAAAGASLLILRRATR